MEPETSKLEKSNLWQLVKSLEESQDDQIIQLNEIVATLLVNFSNKNKGRHPVLINWDDKPFTMLIKVLEYFIAKEKQQTSDAKEVDPDNDFVEKLISELPEYGIDTSKWEYNYGDCCYGGAVEFIARAIKGEVDKSVDSKSEAS